MSARNLILAIGFAAASCLVQAATITYDFTSTPSSTSGSGYGNSISYLNGGVTVKATAWAITGPADTFQSGQIARYSTGLGICDRDEGLNCDDPAHQVDNVGAYEFVLFQFSKPVDPLTITIDPYGTWDRDVTYYVGGNSGTIDLSGKKLTDLLAMNFVGPTNDDATVSGNPRSVSLTSGVVNAVLFGSRVDGDSSDDRFKISGMTAATPEPGTLGLFGAAALVLGAGRKFRRVAQR